MNELRVAALRQASDDCRQHMAGQTFQAASETVVFRAKAYLDFLLGNAPAPKPKKKAKR